MSYVGPTLHQRVGPTMAQRASWRWANVICERWPNEAANQNTPLVQRCHAIWEAPIYLWKLYVEAVIESEAWPAVMQLKSEA